MRAPTTRRTADPRAVLTLGLLALLFGCASDARRAELDNGAVFADDGRVLIFHSYADAEGEIVELDPASGIRRPITRDGARHDRWPSVADAGGPIVFISMRDGPWNVFRVERDGSDLRNLTPGPAPHIGAAISPSGERIAFGRGGDGPPDLYLMNADGSASRLLAEGGVWPAWSPDGRHVYFVHLLPEGGTALAVVEADGGAPRVLTDPAVNAAGTGVTPDERSVNLTAEGASGRTLQRFDLGTGRLVDLGVAANGDSAPRVAPDGRRLVFGYGIGDSDGDVFRLDLETGALRNLTGGIPVEALRPTPSAAGS